MTADEAVCDDDGANIRVVSLVDRQLEIGRHLLRWDAGNRWAMDTVTVVAVFLGFGLSDALSGHGSSDSPVVFAQLPPARMLLLQAALILPLWWRRRAPLATCSVVLAVAVAQWTAGIMLKADFAVLVAIFSLVLHGRLRSLPWVAPWAAGAVVVGAVRLTGDAFYIAFFLLSNITAAVALGVAIRIRRAQLAVLRERAVRLEVERDQRTRLAAATERTRVAREMHDIVGHSLAVIVSLADGGAYAVHTDPRRGAEALRLIADTGRTSLTELRRMLGVLREAGDKPDLSPQPGLADLESLCRQIAAAGPRVDYSDTAALHTLDVGVQLATYRIAQEALTNALKHAGPRTRIDLALRVDGRRVRLRVHDTGPPAGERPAPAGGEGLGIVGMRERAGLYAGTVTAGPARGGGWTVRATLALESEPA
ncbi:sensor histidine kinase [Actinoplanes sp. NPDC049265]|uniref:sensor histidine kinase n=1 Tax=Actinoplanes sp. NPDC049265 TaxID=3363902 RepID=UPI0037203FC2